MAQIALGVASPFGADVTMQCSDAKGALGLVFVVCTAVSADGLQDATAVLVSEAGPPNQGTVQWTLSRGEITTCTTGAMR